MFHDAVEDVSELSDEENTVSSQIPRASDDPEMTRLRSKLASLHRQRARIRNKKVSTSFPLACGIYQISVVPTLQFQKVVLAFCWTSAVTQKHCSCARMRHLCNQQFPESFQIALLAVEKVFRENRHCF